MITPEQLRNRLTNIDEKLRSNGAMQQRFSRPCTDLFELKLKALDLIVEKAQLQFALSRSAT